jgi:hypothetical protein
LGPQDPKDVSRDIARDLSALVGELAALKGDGYPLAPNARVRRPRALPRERARCGRGGIGGGEEAGVDERWAGAVTEVVWS